MYKQWYIFLDLTITLPEILKLDCHLENMALKSIKVIHTFIFLLSVQGLLGTKKNQLSTVLPTANIPCF